MPINIYVDMDINAAYKASHKVIYLECSLLSANLNSNIVYDPIHEI